ncbi:MAG TPA: transglutaminase-like domain-containing protein [Anaerovoracaceae bacterium]|nr:transglutaminase-like domain-containing protein [Anaerovoracaceae bacterium]
MNFFSDINIITVLIIGIFLMPVLAGILYPISGNRIQVSLLSIINGCKFILGIILSLNLTRVIFSGKENAFLVLLYQFVPVRDLLSRYNHDIVAHIIVMFIFLSIILCILEILTIPLHRYVIVPLAARISPAFNSLSSGAKRILSGIWQLPKSVCMVLAFSLLLSFYSTYINNPSTGDYINNSAAYQMINKNILHPILSTDTAKQIPVLINDSFRKAAEDFTPANNDNNGNPNYWKLPVIKYFNGMTLDEAVKSNSEIDNTAKQIVGTEKNDKKKAYLLYKWISKTIQYDKEKAEIIVTNPSHVNSGSIVTFADSKGVCFDYSCLYVSMCRAVGLKVRFVTGLGYNGAEWGDHSWNQVYDPEEKRWINVDTTFGSSGYDNFDNPDFATNHTYDVVQGEW